MSQSSLSKKPVVLSHSDRALELIAGMTLAEKIGQMSQLNGSGWDVRQGIAEGRVGSVLNEVDVEVVNELQRLAMEETRLGIPLLIGRDVIHGFKTIFPIPLAQAASWNPAMVKQCAAIAAAEAASSGINWTFAPMIDITRDPRWGRIAESLGEDPYLCSVLGAAMVKGFQGDTLGDGGSSIAACAKHMAGYGAVESGLDYNTVNIPENELRNVYLRPFHAAKEAGVATFMSSFSDLNGVPASGNTFLMQQVLRKEWGFEGFVVSDWDSIKELSVHGFTGSDRESALAAINAGIDMEMASSTYAGHLGSLLDQGAVSLEQIDALVFNILQIKLQLGLFENPYTNPSDFPALVNEDYLLSAKKAAQEGCVLLKNDHHTLPLCSDKLHSLALIGPLTDEAYEQMGTWVFDGESRHSRTCLQGVDALVGDKLELHWARGTQTSRSNSDEGFAEAIAAAQRSDAVVMFVGEESILSGEAHCRANIDLPGNQVQLIEAIAATGKSITLVVLAGRPLTLSNVIDQVDAVLYAWHPGTMAGPAIAELLFGIESPSGKLPVSFPRSAGQIPIYYAKKNTGRPPSQHTITHIDDIDGGAVQTSLGMSAFHLDDGFTPLFPFGFGLSYSRFELTELALSTHNLKLGEGLQITVQLHNVGDTEAEEVVQLYTRDLVGNVTRPIRELKGFQKVRLAAGQSQQLTFDLHSDELAFYNQQMQQVTEIGDFHLWVGNSSEQGLWAEFKVV
ncbi:MAG: beta-glucosidase [Paraglaciecola psychrophila]|jgi:beta-glucosidase